MTRILLSLALLVIASTANASVIDLSTWSKQGAPGNGNWVVGGGGNFVDQTINGNPTFFVSPENFSNTLFQGTFQVTTTGDDDYIGFVFGYNSPTSSTGANDFDFLLFDWKQSNQTAGGFLASEGFNLSRVQGTITDYIPGFWGHTDSTGFDVLASDYGPTRGWEDNTEYEFTLIYTPTQIKIGIKGGSGDFANGQTIFNISGDFPSGRFGFYNYSQSNVRYAGFTQDDPPPPNAIPEPASVLSWTLLLGLAYLGRRRLRRRAP